MHSAAPLPDDLIVAALWDCWHLRPETLVYAPVGYGSWHWEATTSTHGSLFVTVDAVATCPSRDDERTPLADLAWAYGVPLVVHRAGMTIARPPLPTLDGHVVVTVAAGWAMSVWPFLEGRASQAGRYTNVHDACAVLDVVGALHDLPLETFAAPPRREAFVARGLGRLLELVDHAWPRPLAGPHASAADELLHRHASDIRRLAEAHRELARQAPPTEEWVLTHGEPHAANVVFTSDGPVLIDWDTAMVAPRERDLWMIAADGFDVGPVNSDIMRLYRAQWDLSELAHYARRFADPRDDGPEGDESWDDFMSYLERTTNGR